MSDTATSPILTPEQQARADRAAAIQKRADELTSLEGKWYLKNDGTGLPVQITRYNGIHVIDGIATYFIAVEIRGHSSWNAGATDFLAAHHLMDPQPFLKQPETDLPR